jgi:hypothetical protein
MSQTPGTLAASRVALMPDGDLAEAVLDDNGHAFARWYSSGAWSQWFFVGAPAVDVSVAGANVSSTDTAYVTMIFSGGGRGVYQLTSSGVTSVNL